MASAAGRQQAISPARVRSVPTALANDGHGHGERRGSKLAKVRAAHLSYGRLPDGGHHLVYGLWPTAGKPNELFVAPRLPLPVVDTFACPAGHLHPLMVLYPGSPLARRHLDAPLLICP